MGLFQMAYPVYATLLAIATAGFPVAISKIVSERIALGDVHGARQTFRMAMGLLTTGGIVCFGLLYGFAPVWARIAGDPGAEWAIRAIAPALLLVPVMSTLRGYFQGYQWMEPTAYSQVLEQIVRVATILGLASWLTSRGYSQAVSAAGAAFGAVTGAAAGFLLLLYFWRKRHPHVDVQDGVRATTWQLAKQLLYVAFPISLGALVVPLMNNVDVITVVNLLKAAGEPQHLATTEFGLLSGRAAKLMMLPTTLAAGIGIAVMPAVSEAFTLGFRKLITERVDTSVRLTVLLALPASFGLAVLAKPVDIALFKDTAGATSIQVMAFATIFASVQTTFAAILQGAGWVYLPVINLLAASGVKVLCNLWLVPLYGIDGAAAATVLSYATAAVLNFWAMKRCLGQGLPWRRWVLRPAVATFIMTAAVFAMNEQWERWGGLGSSRLSVALALLVMLGVGMVVYLIAMLAADALTPKELASIPKIGPRLVLWCGRLGLIR